MLSLNTLRTKFGIVLSVVIGATLLAFVLGDFFGNRNQGEIPQVGEINGEEIGGMEFRRAYDEATFFMDNNTDASGSMAINAAWESLVYEKVYASDLNALGLVVTESEAAEAFEETVAANPYFQQMLENNGGASLYSKMLSRDLAIRKYIDLVRCGAYANALVVNKGVAAQNNTYKGHFVVANYSSINDEEVAVSDKEIKNYYEENLTKYKQTPYRTVSYVHFDVEPSEADKQAIETAARELTKTFSSATDLKEYTALEAKAQLANNYVTADDIESAELGKIRNGRTFGPEKRGDNWYASRRYRVITAPKDLELQHIILAKQDGVNVDSLYTVAKVPGADFAALVKQHSLYPDAENDEIEFSQLPIVFADALANVKTNNVVKIDRGDVVFITKVVKAENPTRHYRIATLEYPIEASKETKDAIYAQACEFVRNAKGSIENFNNAATEVSASSVNLNRGDRTISGLPNSTEVARWAVAAKVGAVSDIMNVDNGWAVVVVTAVDDEEYKSLNAVSAEIKRTLVREKKAEMLKAKMQGATLAEIAESVGAEVKEFNDAKLSAYYVNNIGVEPHVIGALAGVTAEATGTLLPLVEGGKGVFAVVVDEVAVAEEATAEAEKVKLQAQQESMASYLPMIAAKNYVNLVDNTLKNF